MRSVSPSFLDVRRTGRLAAAVVGLIGSASGVATAAYTYTDVNALAGAGTYSSRILSIAPTSGELQGFYQTSSSTASRVYFTTPGGVATAYAAGLTSPVATGASSGFVGQLLNDGGAYLAESTATTPSTGGVNTPPFTAIPLSTTYNGTFSYTTSTAAAYTQTQTASAIVPASINIGGSVVGTQSFALTNATNGNAVAQHGIIYSGGTTTDIGGNPAGLTTFPTGNNEAAIGISSLTGISNTNVVVGSQGTAARAAVSSTPTDAIYGTPVAGGYSFSDLATTLISTLIPTGDTYYSSNATAISDNGQYVVGTYQYTVGTGTTKYTHSFELSNDSSIVDLGYLYTTNNATSNVLDATAVNDSGTVVGYGYLGSTSIINGFVYSNGTLSNLNSIGAPTPTLGTYAAAYGIDDAGDIIGYSTASGTATTGAVTDGFVLTAGVPEPASLGLGAIGGGLLLARRRSRVGRPA